MTRYGSPVLLAAMESKYMGYFKSLEAAQEFFKGERFAIENGMHLDELGEGWAVCSMEIQNIHMNAVDRVMGGAIFTLADFAMAAAANNYHCPNVGLNATVNFLGAAKGRKLFARAECIKDGRTTSVFGVNVYDELGTKVAYFTGTSFKIQG